MGKKAQFRHFERYESLRPPLPSEQELKIPIKELRVFPIAGVQSTGPDFHIDIGPYGLKYDREVALLPTCGSNMPLKSWRYLPMSKLR